MAAPPRGMTRVASHEHQNQEHIMVVASPGEEGGQGGGGGANACLGCCDARIAVIVVNVFLILGGFMHISVGNNGLVASREYDDFTIAESSDCKDSYGEEMDSFEKQLRGFTGAAVLQTQETAQALKNVSVMFNVAGIFQLVFAAIGTWGAIAFRAKLVRANAVFVAVNSLVMFVLPAIVGSCTGFLNPYALVLLLFVRPHLQFAKEVEEGQMDASTYRSACCCCPRPALLVPVGSEETFEDEPQDSIIEMASAKAGIHGKNVQPLQICSGPKVEVRSPPSFNEPL